MVADFAEGKKEIVFSRGDLVDKTDYVIHVNA